jgi:cytochrome c5
MNTRHLAASILVLASASALALAAKQNAAPSAAPSNGSAAQKQQVQPQNEGERVFQQNCSRCHNAPEGFSPRISGTIVRHMRIRASLSEHDEEELLRFFNP